MLSPLGFCDLICSWFSHSLSGSSFLSSSSFTCLLNAGFLKAFLSLSPHPLGQLHPVTLRWLLDLQLIPRSFCEPRNQLPVQCLLLETPLLNTPKVRPPSNLVVPASDQALLPFFKFSTVQSTLSRLVILKVVCTLESPRRLKKEKDTNP